MESKRPEDTAFKQQRLAAWQPLLTPWWVIGTFVVVAIVFIPVGVIILSASNGVVEYEMRYDNMDGCALDGLCTITFNINKEMKQPIYLYYKLTNFYQNHRRYVKSRSDDQLRGANPSEVTNCDPLSEWGDKKMYPCGLIAASYFNDTFQADVCKGAVCDPLDPAAKGNWTNVGIAWDSDKKEKFKVPSGLDMSGLTDQGPQGQLPKIEDEEFMVWMRTAGLPTFKKLHRIIKVDLHDGDTLKVYANNRFRVAGFDGTKSVVISTTSWLGGKNEFLAYAYIIVGGLCLLLAIVFAIKHLCSPRLLGDMSYLQWGGNQAKQGEQKS